MATETTIDVAKFVAGLEVPTKKNGKAGHPYLYITYGNRRALVDHLKTKYHKDLRDDDCVLLSRYMLAVFQADGAKVNLADVVGKVK